MSQVISIDYFKKRYRIIQITLYNCFNTMNTKMKQFSRTGTDFLKVDVYRATKWNMKEIGEINNRHKSQSTEGINFHKQQEKGKAKNPQTALAKK